MLLCLNMTPGEEEEERTGQDRAVLGDTSRVGDVTGKRKAIGVTAFGVLLPKTYEEEADRLYVGDFPQKSQCN